MGKFLQKYGILFFFCAMMGGIIMVDSIFAIAFTEVSWKSKFQFQ